MKPKVKSYPTAQNKKKSSRHLLNAFLVLCFLLLFFWLEKQELPKMWGQKCNVSNTKWTSFNAPRPVISEVHGIDVSHYSCNINWSAVKNMREGNRTVNFVFMRSTRGARLKDEKFDAFWYQAKQNGLVRGAYHFFNFTESPVAQAQFYLLETSILADDLPPVLDIEDDKETPKELLTPDYVLSRMLVWLKIVERTTGKVPIIYCNQAYYSRYIRGRFPNNPIWIASYADQPPQLGDKDWTFWQYSNSGRCAGISEKIDLNVFNGTKNDFNQFISKTSRKPL